MNPRLENVALVNALHNWMLTLSTVDMESARENLASVVAQKAPLLGNAEVQAVCRQVLQRMDGLGDLEPLLADPDVTDILVNGPGTVWVDRAGQLEPTPVTLDRDTIDHLVERIVAPLGRRIDRTSPFVDARLSDGSRVHVAVPPLAVDGPYLTIRRFSHTSIDLEQFASPGTAALLRWAMHARMNVLVSGATGAGKTTLLSSLAACIPVSERVITIEDAAELQLGSKHVVRMESRPQAVDGPDPIDIRELVRNALRMRPDRIIVGEVRGPEALDMLQAMNTGHDGSLSTCHANGPSDALRRLETMVLTGAVLLPLHAIRDQIRSAVDLVVHVQRNGPARQVVAVDQVVHVDSAEVPQVVGDPIKGHRVPWLLRLATADGLVALPTRPPRNLNAPPPDPQWLERKAS